MPKESKKKAGANVRRKNKVQKSTSPTKKARKKAPTRARLVSARSKTAMAGALTFDQVKNLVQANKKSAGFTDECVISVCWKESSFNPSAQSGSSTAKGLMQMTNPAVDTVNNITPTGVHFQYADMLDAAKAIQCGTYYLQWCLDQSAGNEAKGLDKYAGVNGYSANVIAAENCLLTGVDPPMTCLGKIHSFLLERAEAGLIDNASGKTRFMKKE
jgi:hypothetical protein